MDGERKRQVIEVKMRNKYNPIKDLFAATRFG